MAIFNRIVDLFDGFTQMKTDDCPQFPPLKGGASNFIAVADCSGSMESYASGTQTRWMLVVVALLAAIVKLRNKSRQFVTVITFDHKARLVAIPTSPNDPRLKNKLRKIVTEGGTDLSAGLRLAVAVVEQAKASETRIVILSDGHWMGDPMPCARRLKQLGCTLYTVGVGKTPRDVDEAGLKEVASRDAAGNPLYRFIKDDATELTSHFESIASGIVRKRTSGS